MLLVFSVLSASPRVKKISVFSDGLKSEKKTWIYSRGDAENAEGEAAGGDFFGYGAGLGSVVSPRD